MIARIYLQMSTKNKGSTHRYVSSDCYTKAELDAQIDRLINELETLRAEGHVKFSNTEVNR